MSVVHLVGEAVSLRWTSAADEVATITVINPDGTTATAPTITSNAKVHTGSFTPTVPGRHRLLWETPTQKFADVLDVWPENPRYLVSREDALDRLQRKGHASELDAIMLYIAAATCVVESITGPLLPEERTWQTYLTRPAGAIVLPHHEVTVSSIEQNSVELAPGSYAVDTSAGIVHALAGKFEGGVKVTYGVGASEVPAPARMACLEIVAHSWNSTRQGLVMPANNGELTVTPTGFAIPNRAYEWLQALPKVAGIA